MHPYGLEGWLKLKLKVNLGWRRGSGFAVNLRA